MCDWRHGGGDDAPQFLCNAAHGKVVLTIFSTGSFDRAQIWNKQSCLDLNTIYRLSVVTVSVTLKFSTRKIFQCWGVPSHSGVLCAARDSTVRKVCASEYKLPRVLPTISENLAGKVRYSQKSELDKMPMHFIFWPSRQFGQETMGFAAILLGIVLLGY